VTDSSTTDLLSRDIVRPAMDGYPLSMRLIAHPNPTHAILVTSGTGFPKRFYERFARHLAAKGAAVMTYDFRGIAGSRPDDLAAMVMDYPDWGRLDMPAAVEALAEAAPGLPILHVGHSVGGHFVGFMPNHARIVRHAFVSVGVGYWGLHHRNYNPLELFFWLGFGPCSLARRRLYQGRRSLGRDRPAARGVRNLEALVPEAGLFRRRTGRPAETQRLRGRHRPDPVVDLHRRSHRHPGDGGAPAACLSRRTA
jgi:hypothetical protein